MLDQRQRLIDLTRPGINLCKGERHSRPVESVLGFREEFDRTFPFANGVFLAIESSVDQPELRVTRGIIRQLTQLLLNKRAGAVEGFARSCLVVSKGIADRLHQCFRGRRSVLAMQRLAWNFLQESKRIDKFSLVKKNADTRFRYDSLGIEVRRNLGQAVYAYAEVPFPNDCKLCFQGMQSQNVRRQFDPAIVDFLRCLVISYRRVINAKVLQDPWIFWVQFRSSLEIGAGFRPFSLSPLNRAQREEHFRIIP